MLRLPANHTAAAVNPENGDVAFVSLRSGQLWLLKSAWFDGDAAAQIGPVTSVENPSWVAFKRYQSRTFVVVGCFAAGPVRVFAADTLQDLRFAHNQRADAVWLSVSRNFADPLIYVSSRTNGQPAVGVVNLAAKQLEWHPLLTFGRSPAKVAGAVVSSSGRTLYQFGDDGQRLTAWRVHPPDSPDKPPRLERLSDQPDNAATRTQPPIALPYDLGLVDGDAVLSPEAGPARTVLPVPVSCVQDEQPRAFGLSDQQLSLLSLDSPRVLARRPLAGELFDYQPHEREVVTRSAGSDHRFVIGPVVLADPGRERVLVFGNRDVQVLPYSGLPRTDQVWLGLEVDVPRVIAAGKPWTTRVRKSDSQATVQLQSAPDGMTLRDDELAWMPSREQIGLATFTLQLERAGQSVRHDLRIEVKGPALACPFPATQVAVDPEGKRLIAWTNQGAVAKLALLDPATDRVLAERTISGDVVCLRITPSAVCLISTNGTDQALLALDPQTLQTKAQATVKVTEYRQKLGSGLLQLRGRDRIVLDKCYSLPDLSEVTPPKSPAGGRPHESTARLSGGPWIEGRVDGGWCQEGVIWDEALSQPRAMLSAADFLPIGPVVSFWDNAWLRRPASRSGSFSAKEMSAARTTENAHSVAATELPIILELALGGAGQPGMAGVELVARGRLDRQELRRWPIDVLQVEPQRSCSYCLVTDGLAAGVILAGRVYSVDLSELPAGTYPRPLALAPVQSTLLAAAEGPTRLTYHASGGQPPYTLKASLPGAGDLNLVRPLAGGNLDLEVDAPGYLTEQSLPLARALVDQSPATEGAEAIMDRYRQARTPAFRRLTGRDPAGVPVAMPLEVRVLDSGSQSARFTHYLLVEVPPDTLIPPLDAEIASRWKGTTVAAAARQRWDLHRGRTVGDTARRAQPEPAAEIRLPLRPVSMALSEDGRYAAVWDNRPNTVTPAGPAGALLCLVDVEAKRIAGQRELQQPILAATVGTRAVLVLHGETIEILRRADLTPVKSLALSRPAADIVIVGDRWLFVRQPLSWNALQLPELTESPLLRMLLADQRGEELLPPVVATPGGWRVGPAVLDASLRRVQFFRSLGPLGHTGLISPASDWEGAPAGPGRRQFALQKRTLAPVTCAGGVRVSATVRRERADQDAVTSVQVEATTADGRRTRFPPSPIPEDLSQVPLLGAGRTVAFLAGDRLFVVDLGELGSEPPRQAAALSVHPEPGVLVLATEQKTTVRYTITGGQEPYVLQPAAAQEELRGELNDLVVTGTQPQTLVIDGAKLASATTEDRFGVPLAAKICGRTEARGLRSAGEIVAAYIAQANRSLAPHVGRTFRDVPVAVTVGVTVTDAAASSVSLSHDLILEVPRAKIEDLVGRELARRSPEATRTDAWADSDANRVPAIELPLLRPEDATPGFISDLMRRTYPPVALPQEPLAGLAAKICLRSLDADFKFRTSDHPQNDPRPERTWKTQTGRTLTGRLTAIVGGHLQIGGSAAPGDISISQLDAASLQWAWQDVARFQRTDSEYEKRKLRLLGRALRAYYLDYGCFPPQALVDARGRPLLSWRVLLLPYLGQADLLRLFRLDEPWDGAHNRQLIPYMPLVYTTAEEPLDPGHSNVVALVGPQTAFPPHALRRLSDFTDPPAETLVIADVVEQGAVVWTQPADLDLSSGGRAFQRLYKRAVGRTGEPATTKCTGIFADGTAAYFASQRDFDVVLRAAGVDDGQGGADLGRSAE